MAEQPRAQAIIEAARAAKAKREAGAQEQDFNQTFARVDAANQKEGEVAHDLSQANEFNDDIDALQAFAEEQAAEGGEIPEEITAALEAKRAQLAEVQARLETTGQFSLADVSQDSRKRLVEIEKDVEGRLETVKKLEEFFNGLDLSKIPELAVDGVSNERNVYIADSSGKLSRVALFEHTKALLEKAKAAGPAAENNEAVRNSSERRVSSKLNEVIEKGIAKLKAVIPNFEAEAAKQAAFAREFEKAPKSEFSHSGLASSTAPEVWSDFAGAVAGARKTDNLGSAKENQEALNVQNWLIQTFIDARNTSALWGAVKKKLHKLNVIRENNFGYEKYLPYDVSKEVGDVMSHALISEADMNTAFDALVAKIKPLAEQNKMTVDTHKLFNRRAVEVADAGLGQKELVWMRYAKFLEDQV